MPLMLYWDLLQARLWEMSSIWDDFAQFLTLLTLMRLEQAWDSEQGLNSWPRHIAFQHRVQTYHDKNTWEVSRCNAWGVDHRTPDFKEEYKYWGTLEGYLSNATAWPEILSVEGNKAGHHLTDTNRKRINAGTCTHTTFEGQVTIWNSIQSARTPRDHMFVMGGWVGCVSEVGSLGPSPSGRQCDHPQFTELVLPSVVLLAFKSLAVRHLCHKVGELAFFRTWGSRSVPLECVEWLVN